MHTVRLIFLMVASLTALALLLPCTSAPAPAPAAAPASAPTSSQSVSGADLMVTNLHGNHTIFLAGGPRSNFAGNNAASCSDGRATSYGIKPGMALSLEVQLRWSGLVCIKDIISSTSPIAFDSSRGGTLRASPTTNIYHASIVVGMDLPLDVKPGATCDDSLSKMKPGSDCPNFTCSYQDATNTFFCNINDGHVIIGFSISLIPSRGVRGDGLISCGAPLRKKLTPSSLCVLLLSLLLGSRNVIHRTYEFLLD